MYRVPVALLFLASAVFVACHPERHVERSPAELARRALEAERRASTADKCAARMRMHQRLRRRKRTLAGQHDFDKRAISTASLVSTTPHYSELQNTTCVLNPEIEEGPYYSNSQFVRQDLRENQKGVTLILDIGVIDINTCEPAKNVYLEIWNANATGIYSDFAAAQDLTETSQTSDSFLRGGWPTDDAGIVELTTIFPGFYTGRTLHTHMVIRSNYSIEDDGTLAAASGTVHHIGQMFFDETIANEIMALSPYTENTHTRTYNANDRLVQAAASSGASVWVDMSLLGSNVTDGILGYLTIGIDTSATKTIESTTTLTSLVAAYESEALLALTGSTSPTSSAQSVSSTSSTSHAVSSSPVTASSKTATGTASSSTSAAATSTTSSAGTSVVSRGIVESVLGGVAMVAALYA